MVILHDSIGFKLGLAWVANFQARLSVPHAAEPAHSFDLYITISTCTQNTLLYTSVLLS